MNKLRIVDYRGNFGVWDFPCRGVGFNPAGILAIYHIEMAATYIICGTFAHSLRQAAEAGVSPILNELS